jgi:DNA-directed RNA polymerase specialized sigma24 family protein
LRNLRVARDELRKVQRRSHHEKKAAAMSEELRRAAAPARTDAWSDAETVLDEAMADLDEQTRGLLVLRYFQGQSIRDVAERLGLTEEAARKRISRAIDQLRGIFAHRGVVMSATALAEALTVKTIMRAPAHLVASAASTAAMMSAPSP